LYLVLSRQLIADSKKLCSFYFLIFFLSQYVNELFPPKADSGE